MKYTDLGLKIDKTTSTVKVGGKDVEVLNYLPIEDKIDLIQIALQKAEQNGFYNEMKLDMYFNLYIVKMYTNLEFDDDKDDFELYNELQCNNVILSVIGAMEENEYDDLLNYLESMKINSFKYKRSAAALIATFIQDLPKNAAAAQEIVDNFDKEKFNNVVEFAKSANGGRPI